MRGIFADYLSGMGVEAIMKKLNAQGKTTRNGNTWGRNCVRKVLGNLLPEALLTAGKRYPTAEGYALVSAAEISYPTDKELETWLADPGLYRPQLRGALVVLRSLIFSS